MGADIYIESIYDKMQKKYRPLFAAAVKKRDAAKSKERQEAYQQEVAKYFDLINGDEGYFRDSYNATSLFAQLGLSWWRDVGALLPKEGGHMSVSNMKKLLKMVESKELPKPKDLKLEYVKIDKGANSLENWHKMFAEKKVQFVAFLKRAIEMKEPIRCSI
jgi:hypothetical protein